jgi:hypothetical protein
MGRIGGLTMPILGRFLYAGTALGFGKGGGMTDMMRALAILIAAFGDPTLGLDRDAVLQ